MTVNENILSNLLKAHRYSVTKQRLEVFNLLIGQEPMSMSELIKKANKSLDRASVYRIITLFDQVGITQRLNIGWKYRIELTDKFAEHHHHLTCLNCHSVTPINREEIEEVILQLTDAQDFTPIEHQVEIQGFCSSCKITLRAQQKN